MEDGHIGIQCVHTTVTPLPDVPRNHTNWRFNTVSFKLKVSLTFLLAFDLAAFHFEARLSHLYVGGL
jgi:hypothetical protein